MEISLTIPDEFTVPNHGYGVISQEIVHSLQRLGHRVPYRDPAAQLELAIGQPYHWNWANFKGSYKIGFVAWESTKIPDRWKPWLKTADEVWVTSPWVKEVFENEGYKVTQVYEHGIDTAAWRPKRRVQNGPVKFLRMGEPAPRKGGQMAYDAFKELYADKVGEATLTIKAHNMSTIRGRGNAHPDRELKNVKLITEDMPEWQVIDLVRRHDVLIYPSYGEGYGMIPLQAMATGMPVICTESWAAYKRLILPGLRLGSQLIDSPWKAHTGQVLQPDYNDLITSMRRVVESYQDYADKAHSLVPHIQRRHDWDRLTAKAFARFLDS